MSRIGRSPITVPGGVDVTIAGQHVTVKGPKGELVREMPEGVELSKDDDGQVALTHSVSAGLDYAAVGPEHAWLHDVGRAEYVSITDAEALEAFQLCCRLEGIIPALEPSHALAQVMKLAPTLPKDRIIVMNMCGRGDKDIFTVADALKVTL